MAGKLSQGPWWLRPLLPELDAEATDFCDYTPTPKPDFVQLDTFFWMEHIQLLRFGGLRAYEALILQELEPYTPRLALPKGLSGYESEDTSENEEDTSGMSASDDNDDYSIDDEEGGLPLFAINKMTTAAPRPWVERDFVEVDETKWFKLFQRDRWASYSNADPKQLSVDIDNDKDWGRLSRVIEIANRILSEALDQEWMASLLNPQARDSRGPVSSGTGNETRPNTVIYRVAPVPPQSRLSREQARKALDDIAKHFFWGFHMADEFPGASGKTTHIIENTKRETYHWMTLLLSSMEPVFREKTRGDPEGRQAAVGTANIMLHELAHALSSHFHHKMPKSGNLPCNTGEFFFKEERWAEAGYSFEKAIFGTVMKDYWLCTDDRIHYLGVRGMNPETCAASPHYRYDDWAPEDPYLDMPLGIPAIVSCATTTSDFWNSHVKKYGYPSLRLTWVCEGKFEIRNGQVQMWPAKIMDQPYKYSRYDDLNKSMKAVAQALRKRRLDLKRLRPWYAQEYALWSKTLYAETSLRVTMNILAQTLSGRSLHHEDIACSYIGKLLQPHSQFSDLEAASPAEEMASTMFYQAMGFLGQAALPVRRGTVTYKDENVGGYPDRIRPAMRPGFAGPKLFINELVRYGESLVDAKKTKTLYSSSSPSHDRELCMSNARLAFLRWKMLGCFTASTAKDFELEWQCMRRQLDQWPLDDARFEWSSTTWLNLRSYAGELDHQTASFFRAGEKPEQLGEGVDADIPAGAIARPAIPSGPARPVAPWIPYYTAGEVGNFQRLDGLRKWGCVWNGREMAIYDITSLLTDGTWTKSTRAYAMQPCLMPLCRRVRPDRLSQEWLDRFQRERPLGYVSCVRRKEDVRINDGKEGRPRWVIAGEDVYDVTNIQLREELQGLEAILTGTSEEPIVEALNRGYHPDVIRSALRPRRIGWAQNTLGERRQRKHRVFTATEVMWHTARETGIYVIVDKKVYDLTGFLDHHPGGTAIILDVAGTDATVLWNQYHGSPISEFGFNVHHQLEMLQIGRVVEERFDRTAALHSTEICIRDCVFSKYKIDAEDRILGLLDGRWGSDATADMEKQNPPEGLRRLWERPELVIAKFGTKVDKLPHMNPTVLAKMDGKERPGGFNESFVSDGNYIYNLTSLLRYGTRTQVLERLKTKAGRVLDSSVPADEELRTWLAGTNAHRIVGLLRAPKHTHTSEEKPVAWRASYRRTPSTAPKPASMAAANRTGATPKPAPAPYTVRPLYPLRKKRKKTKHDGAEDPYPKLRQLSLQDDGAGDPMDLSRTDMVAALEDMGFPAGPERGGGRA